VTATPLEYLFSLEQFGIKFGLDNVRAILEALGHPENAFSSIHVAGTNGKGSVTAMVDAGLRAAGYHSARYTSPHLVDLTERFVIDGQPTTRDALSEVVAVVRDVVADLRTRGTIDVHPTFFEVTTAAAFELFRRASVEVAVCEVGLGGRLDATNVLTPMVTAITSIGLDHEQYLGTTLADIAGEKAGIIKPAVPVVVGKVDPEAAAVIERIARERNAPVIRAHENSTADEHPSAAGLQRMRLQTPMRDYGVIDVALAGRHQIDNAVVATRILETLDAAGWRVPQEAVIAGLATVEWPGRLEHVDLVDGRGVLLDAAHNPAGARALAAFLAGHGPPRPLVFAAMRDKDVRAILSALVPHVSAIVLTRASHPRSADPSALAELAGTVAPTLPRTIRGTPHEALDAAWQLSREILVAGSIFLLGDVMQALSPSTAMRTRRS
jgi:dihydrofolate synthase/folylpolyglutamate synthase